MLTQHFRTSAALIPSSVSIVISTAYVRKCCVNIWIHVRSTSRYRIYNMMSLGMGIDNDDSEVIEEREEQLNDVDFEDSSKMEDVD